MLAVCTSRFTMASSLFSSVPLQTPLVNFKKKFIIICKKKKKIIKNTYYNNNNNDRERVCWFVTQVLVRNEGRRIRFSDLGALDSN